MAFRRAGSRSSHRLPLNDLRFGKPGHNTECQGVQLQMCTSRFTQFIGYNTTNLWKEDPQLLLTFLQQKMAQDVGKADGLVTICNGLENLIDCLGPDNYKLCLRPPNMVKQGTTEEFNFRMVGTLDMFSFQCGAGFFTAVAEEFSCIQRIILHYSKTLDGCRQTYYRNLLENPENNCQIIRDLGYCTINVFANAECHVTQRGDLWWACEGQVA
ncbi:hypothetical protein L596_005969 [Steinernema carpocapsae]|uniref:DUF19 domain-containing protein n=1 Tax=Steinernema carpocapsae TaxID=34508 RepID=A0A4U8V5N6_STECR|nr:hypothetical protein L596_005969 [Steinernema carpocapsae]